MLLSLGAIGGGFALLVWGADRFVVGAAALARNLGVSPLIIGLTIVGLGTSAPEILVSAVAAWEGNPGLAIGNALGSNITNIALILGTTALVVPLQVGSATLRRELPVLLGVMLLGLLLILDQRLGRVDGLILLGGLGLMLLWMTRLGVNSRRERADPLAEEFSEEIPTDVGMSAALFWLLVGLLVLLFSSRLLVWGAVNVAEALGVSDLIIGLTIVALGTSLPELAASVMSALKQEPDIAIGNVIGSNLFNLLAVFGLPGLIAPGPVALEVLQRDFPVMIGLTLGLFVMAYGFRGPGRINRPEGALLLLGYLGYQALLYFSIHNPTG
ncbi:calcium/sodium antiporter [Thiohalobacter sp. IOR34]|uniref:calcium/sodium antiporter n=1 Tax=Thiohalobacter sp. IOR34 TaxID=3057176 RepID=UPI0025B03DB2|nr:calcium/sodium antiporter [Thiohalobacter sp. IOR34]WJW74853.1 calcium/sodium antiporter [Thiohalobacter sp. IOR34]